MDRSTRRLTVGRIIRIMREARGMKQRDLARIAHVDQTAISKYELTNAEPSIHVLRKLAAALGVTEGVLLLVAVGDERTFTADARILHQAIIDVIKAENKLAELIA